MSSTYYVYILTNFYKSVLYTGVSNNLQQRIIQHYQNRGNQDSFTGKYYAYYLLYYEEFKYIDKAIEREKEIKGWRREKKINLIKSQNPEFQFLNIKLFGNWPPNNKTNTRSLLRRDRRTLRCLMFLPRA